MSGPDSAAPDAGTIPHCYRHPDRETYISCQRCGRPICPDCMRTASVGFQCPECVKEANATMPRQRTAFGGRAGRGQPVVTIALIAINVAFFVIVNAAGGRNSSFYLHMAQTNNIDLPQFGWEGVAQGSYWQLITSSFLHLEVIHLGLNMIGLWIFGSFLEGQLGRWRYLALYLLTGLAASVTVYWITPAHVTSLGASGSIFGLFGAALLILLKARADVTQLLILLVLNMVISFTLPNISWEAHIGGLVAGLAMGAGFAYAPRERRQVFGVAMVVAVFALCVVFTALRTAMLTA